MKLLTKTATASTAITLSILSGAATAQAAVNGNCSSLSVRGNYLAGAKYNFHAAPLKRNGATSYLTNVSGSYVVTNPSAHLNAKVDGYGWARLISRSGKATVPYSWNLGNRGDVLQNSSVAMQNCRENTAFPDDCSSTTAKR